MDDKLTESAKTLPKRAEAEIADLLVRLKKIYAYFNMDEAPSTHIILDAVFLAFAGIFSEEKMGVAVIPEMWLKGVLVTHPVSKVGLCFRGTSNLEYVVMRYDNVYDTKARLVGSGGSQSSSIKRAKGRFFFVNAKHQTQERLYIHIPGAVSQAVALLKAFDLPEVRFCLSDGSDWIFFVLKKQGGELVFYQSAPRTVTIKMLDKSDQPLRELLRLLWEWIEPVNSDIFKLE